MALLEQWRAMIGAEPTRLVALTVWLFAIMAVLVPLERCLPLKRQRVLRPCFNEDLAYYFLGGIVPAFFVAGVAYGAAAAQASLPQIPAAWLAAMPGWARLGLTVVLAEVAYYWAHRWSHEIPFLWRFHAIHHSPVELDWLVNTRAHPLDLSFARGFSTAVLVVLGLGQGTGGGAVDAVAAIAIFNTSWGFFIHSNCRLRLGWLEHVVTTPAFHHWHHANDGAVAANRNYAALLPWIDRLFGTQHLPERALPERYGIAERLPGTLWGQLLMPLRAARRA